MTSEKRILANRINALKGGVKTEAGKTVSRLNAVSHGLLSKEALLPGENGCELAALRESFLIDLQPVGELENLLVERIVSCAWRLKRVVRSERVNTRGRIDYRYNSWNTHMRYETAIERQFYKALHELQSLQEARLKDAVTDAEADSLDESPDKVQLEFQRVFARLNQ